MQQNKRGLLSRFALRYVITPTVILRHPTLSDVFLREAASNCEGTRKSACFDWLRLDSGGKQLGKQLDTPWLLYR